MKYFVKAVLPNESGNAFCADPERKHKMEALMGAIKPEAAYFGLSQGQRTVFCIVDIKSSEELTRISEPLWLALKADVEFTPVMSQDEFKRADQYIDDAVRQFHWKTPR